MRTQVFNQLGIGFLALSLLVTGCTKTRKAKLPDEVAETILAISDVPDISQAQEAGQEASFSLKTAGEARTLSTGQSMKAANEKGVVAIDESSVNVPSRLGYMFANLEMSGQSDRSYQIAFTIDSKAVTAYKVVTSEDELSLLERQIAVSKTEILLQKKVQVSRDRTQTQKLLNELARAQTKRNGQALFVPIFKFNVEAYGIIERVKNDLGEKTSNLTLKSSDWSIATHVKISNHSDDRKMVGVNPDEQEELDRVFVKDRINNRIVSAQDMSEQLGVTLNIRPEARLMTLLDSKTMLVYEVTQLSKAALTASQLAILKSGAKNGEIESCSDEVLQSLPASEHEGCIIVQRFKVPVTYVTAQLPLIDANGARTNTLKFDEAKNSVSTGLVKIAKNVIPEEVQLSENLDPRQTIRLSDVVGKEFFFRRTLEDVAATGQMRGGMAGGLSLVKFELEDKRLVVKKTLGVLNIVKKDAMDEEEVLSIPVRYVKRELKDAAGNPLSVPRFVDTNKSEAEYAVLKWTENTVPVVDSPLAFYGEASCFASVNDQQVVDMDMRLSQGVLNFSYLFSVTMRAEESCLSFFDAFGDYNYRGLNTQFTQKVRERLSFRLNDGATDKSYVPQTPFSAQNALNYGVFTMGVLKPSENGVVGREGSQDNFPTVNDFRKGKVLTYTVGGLPEEPKRRALLKSIATEVIGDWNIALKKAFAGTDLAREENYIQVEFNGENGVNAHLGDLDKNFIWFVDRPMDNGLLGVSQAAPNPRSGMIVADSLIVYSGNNSQSIEQSRKYMQTLAQFKKELAEYRDKAFAEMDKQDQKASEPAKEDQQAAAQVVGVENAQKMISQLMTTRAAQERASLNKVSSISKKSSRVNFITRKEATRKRFAASQEVDGYVDRIFKKVLEMNISSDPTAIEAVAAQEILATHKNALTLEQQALLRHASALAETHGRLQRFFQKTPGCAVRLPKDVYSEAFLKLSEEQQLKASIKPTLAHEMGHSLGLTHNFIGSFDKASFKFEGEKQTPRNYSSIMDYMEDSLQQYVGLGPYDVFAIRSAYTGLIEVRPEARSEAILKQLGFKGSLVNKRFIKIQDIKDSFAAKGWSSFNGAGIKGAVMPFRYCTDKDLGWEPTCRQYDFGTSATEIVLTTIADYNDMYIASHNIQDRLSFDWTNKSRLIGRTIDQMLTMRNFLDEAFYRVWISGQDDSYESDHFSASIEAYKFFLNLVRTPDTDLDFHDLQRFTPVKYQKKDDEGKVVVVKDLIEARQTGDTSLAPDKFETIGIEIDKTLAMQVLTLTGLGHPKYDQYSLAISYLDMESVLGIMDTASGSSPVTDLLGDVLMDDVQAVRFMDDGMAVALPEKVRVTSSMTSYAAISSILGLEATSLDQKDNYANLFKVGKSVGKAPSDRLALSPLGSVQNSQTKISFWALDNSSVAGRIMARAGQKNFFMGLGATLKPVLVKMATQLAKRQVATVEEKPAVAAAAEKELVGLRSELVKVLNNANKKGEIVSKEELEQDPSLDLANQAQLMETLASGVMDITHKLLTAKTPEEKKAMQEAAGKFIQMATEIGQGMPALNSAQKALSEGLVTTAEPGEDMESQVIVVAGEVAPQLLRGARNLDVEYGLLMRNIKFLNDLTILTNPEFTR